MSVVTPYNYVDNGTQLKSGSTSYTFYGWDGYTWEIEFPTDITDVLEIDFSVLPGSINNNTSSFSGRLNIYVLDASDTQIGYVQSPNVSANSSISASTIPVITLTGETVSKIQISGPTNNGPNLNMSSITTSTTFNITTETQLEAVIYTHLVDLTWPTVSGASTYTIRYTEDGGSEIEAITETTELTGEITNLSPGLTYVFNLYTDLDTVNPAKTTTVVSPTISSISVQDTLTRISNDLTLLTDTAISELEVNFRDVLTTGDTLVTDEGDLTFVQDSDTLVVSENEESVLTPFDTSSGGTQTFSVTLPDSNTYVLTYDETLDEVIYNSVSYGINDYLVLGSYKVRVKDL